jgi:hypothetical protein
MSVKLATTGEQFEKIRKYREYTLKIGRIQITLSVIVER